MITKDLRQKVLSLAISGKLVPQDPNDEPAAELLKRVNPAAKPITEDVPFDVPQGWSWCKLGDIGKWQAGSTPSRSEKAYYGGDIPWLKTGDLNDGYIEDIPEKITKKALDETSVKLNPAGSVLIAMYGATIGKLGILKYPATTNQACCACVDYKCVTNLYLFYFLLANRINFVEKGYGGAQPNISKEKIVATLFPLPPLAEQERIVSKLEELLGSIDTIERAQEDLSNIRKWLRSKLLSLAISGKLVPQDPNDEPATELLKRIDPSFTPPEYDEPLPQGWCVAPMSMLCKLIDGDKVADREMINLDAKYLRGTSKGTKLKSGRLIPANSLLILVDGENSGEVFRAPIDGYQGSTFKRLIIDSNMYEKFMLQVINSHRLKLRANKVGAAIPHLNKKLFSELDVLVPPLAEQGRIVAKIEELFAVLDRL